jgi:hypothetical protein
MVEHDDPTVTRLREFVRGEVDPRDFPHREHVRMGFEMLRRHDFVETAYHYSAALRAMTAKIGKPEIFHQTMTIAFLAIIAERLQAGTYEDFADFLAANPDLMSRSVLTSSYSRERLASAAARMTFLLPDLPDSHAIGPQPGVLQSPSSST